MLLLGWSTAWKRWEVRLANESMTSAERVRAALHLERPDRTPVIPTLLPEPAAGLAGISQAEVAKPPARDRTVGMVRQDGDATFRRHFRLIIGENVRRERGLVGHTVRRGRRTGGDHRAGHVRGVVA